MFNKKVDYFWEYEFPFGEKFLKSIFNDEYKRVYSLNGEGIFDLVLYNNKIYHIKLSQGKKLLENDNKKSFRDSDKDIVMEKIGNELTKNNIIFTKNSGKFITFSYNNFIFKIEVIKKTSIPK